jgi:hypothetical protein
LPTPTASDQIARSTASGIGNWAIPSNFGISSGGILEHGHGREHDLPRDPGHLYFWIQPHLRDDGTGRLHG